MAEENVSGRGEVTIHGPAVGLGSLCAPILWGLPQWFGIESATRHYIEAIDELPTFTATIGGDLAGFLSLKQHYAHAAEIYVMGVEYLQVKTLSPSHPDQNYELTRRFYAAVGFRPLEEFPTLWGEANPCLLLVKWLG